MPFRVTNQGARLLVEPDGERPIGLLIHQEELSDPANVERLLQMFGSLRGLNDPEPAEILHQLFPKEREKLEAAVLELAKRERARAAGQAVGPEDDDDD